MFVCVVDSMGYRPDYIRAVFALKPLWKTPRSGASYELLKGSNLDEAESMIVSVLLKVPLRRAAGRGRGNIRWESAGDKFRVSFVWKHDHKPLKAGLQSYHMTRVIAYVGYPKHTRQPTMRGMIRAIDQISLARWRMRYYSFSTPGRTKPSVEDFLEAVSFIQHYGEFPSHPIGR